jgi:hypothetical protein
LPGCPSLPDVYTIALVKTHGGAGVLH